MSQAQAVEKSASFVPSPRIAYILLPITVFCWALGIVAGRWLAPEMPPLALSFWRWGVGAGLMVPLVWSDLVLQRNLILTHWRLLAFLGLAMTGSGALLLWSLHFTTAINATLVNGSQPALTAISAMFLLKDRVTPIQAAGIVAALFGVGIMVVQADLQVLMALRFNVGDFLVIAATLGYTVFALNVHRLPSGLKLSTAVFCIAAFGALQLLPFYLFESLSGHPMPVTEKSIMGIAILSTLPAVVAMYMWSAANRAVGPARAGVFINLLPVFGAFLAVLFLGERLHSYHVLGAIFVSAGISLVILFGRKRTGH